MVLKMNQNWNGLSEAQRQATTQIFAALCTLDDLAPAFDRRQAGERRFGFQELYAYAVDPGSAQGDRVEAAIARDPRLAAELRHLLEKVSTYHGPRMAAASTGSLSSRRGSGFSITLRASRAEPSQIYVLIEMIEPEGATPRTLFVSQHDHRVLKHALPDVDGDTIQLLAEGDSELVQALRDPGSEVFLR